MNMSIGREKNPESWMGVIPADNLLARMAAIHFSEDVRPGPLGESHLRALILRMVATNDVVNKGKRTEGILEDAPDQDSA